MINVGSEKRIIFKPFSLDLANECLWRGSQAIKLRPKAFAVLSHLLGRPGQLITKEQLLNTVWPETFVGDAVLKVAIRQLREALGDNPKTPRFIETAHRRGYRFIGQIVESKQILTKDQALEINNVVSKSPSASDSGLGIVGRDEAMSRMRGWLEKMLRGERQIIFVTGEAGIGKTALVDTFTRGLVPDRVRIARGQCLEQYGTGEAYLPVLEAVARLCREQRQIVDVLRAHAPMWLLQMPSLVSTSDRELLRGELVGATRERMLREMGDALEVLGIDLPLVLILEDLHWSDYSTLDLISYLSRQRQSAHLMVIGTYRAVELIVTGHPLKAVKQELLAKQQCEELPLDYLSEDAVNKYLSVRFPGNRFPARLARLIHERTEGNPLFMVNAVDYLVTDGLISEHEEGWQLAVEIERVEVGVPDSIRQMIEKQVEHLDANDQRTLEAASVAGAEFSALAVAGLGEDRAAVEARCDKLARQRQFIQDCGVQILPNGEAVTRYSFIHALYQSVLYERVSIARRIQLHRRIGEMGELVYGDSARAIAAELAMHFERGRDYERAAKYLQQAADNAIRRFAYKEAVVLSRRGLELVAKLPETAERAKQELCLQLTLGVPLIATQGHAATEVGKVYLKARELCQQLGETPDVSEVLWGLRSFYTLRADLETAREIGEEFLHLAERLPYPGLAMRGHWSLESTFTHLGDFALAIEHFEKALSLYDPERHRDDAFLYALNPGIAMPCFAAWALWFIGQPDRSLELIQEALALARESSEPLGLAHALIFAAILHQFRREEVMAQEQAEAAIAVSSEHGLVMYQAIATMMRAWALIKKGRAEAIEQMREALAALRATGTELFRPHFLALLAEALGKVGQSEEGLRVLEEAVEVAHPIGEGCYLAELYRIKGELLLMQAVDPGASRAATGGKAVIEPEPPAIAQAEDCFHQSIKIAQRQQAKSLELRTVMSLARLFQKQGRKEEARRMLEEIYGWFTEGFDTADLIEARGMLDSSDSN
ncbi:MAG TPA: AAA family ATPase [Pyrinomonadaceae bacterium]|nr:AAA family ATPase [Pyrinomonadaceae bacterium]